MAEALIADVSTPDASELDLPLSGVRVLDLATGPLGAIGRSLAELGAEVVRVEPRAGGADRGAGRIVGGVSLDFVAANLDKRSVALDLDDAADRDRFDDLLRAADVLIENERPGSPEAEMLDVETIRERHPQLVILSASDFGRTGGRRDWRATDPVLHALSGNLARSGLPGRPPLLPPGDLATSCAVPQAVFALLLAYINRLKTGRGDHLDFSLLDGTVQAMDPGYGIGGSAAAGVPASRLPRGRVDAGHLYPIIACADGHVRLCVLAPRQWRGMWEWMGRPDAFADPSFAQLQVRFASAALIPAIARFFADKTRAEIEEAGQRHGVPVAAVLDLDEALATEQIAVRRAFVPVEIAPGVSAPSPDGVMEVDGRRAGIRRPAPALDEGAGKAFVAPGEKPKFEGGGDMPLSGVRVLDLGVIVVGAEQGRLLADAGADVIKVENAAFPDGSRQNRTGGPISQTFAAGHRNKRALGLNLRDPRGKTLLLRLVERSDIVLSNFKPGTLDSLGLGRDVLSAASPRIVTVESSAYGPTGPWSRRLGYGPLVRASAGLTVRWRYPDEPESFSDAITAYPDHVAARVGAIGALALLIRRACTGRGGAVGVAQSEVMLSHMAPAIAARALDAEDADEDRDAPWGVFQCAGDDEWCVVTVRNGAEWRSLVGVIGRPDLLEDETLATRAGRSAARERIDAAVGVWLRDRDPRDAMALLQANGVPAGAMLRVSDLPGFSYFEERGFFRRATHPHIAQELVQENAPIRATRLPDPPARPAPLPGEHTSEIATAMLGLTDDELAELVEAGVLEVPTAYATR